MKEEKLFEIMAEIDENYVVEAHKTSTKKAIKKKKALWVKFAAVAACLCIVAVGAIRISKLRTPVQTAGGSGCETITIYNDNKYIALVSPEALEEVGLSETITEDIVGEHVAYLELSGDNADYIETEKETDIELYACTAKTTREVYILRDGDVYWPVVKMEEIKKKEISQGEKTNEVIQNEETQQVESSLNLP